MNIFRQQYAEFKREVENMKSGVNQNASELYKSPITKFENLCIHDRSCEPTFLTPEYVHERKMVVL